MDSNLKNVYEDIASEFDETRQRVWSCVQKFLNTLSSGSTGLEIGCGNGKNMKFRDDLIMTGVDFCENFIKICQKKKLDVYQADMRSLPIKDNSYDFSISIAVLHHLFEKKDRLKAISEQLRVTKKGGRGMILVWALEQEKSTQPRRFKSSDEMVSWKRKDGKTLYRYYHLYQEKELIREVSTFKNISVKKMFTENGNYGVIFTKI